MEENKSSQATLRRHRGQLRDLPRRARLLIARLSARGTQPPLELFDIRYWEARAAGFNPRKMPEAFAWWVRLHPGDRGTLMRGYRAIVAVVDPAVKSARSALRREFRRMMIERIAADTDCARRNALKGNFIHQ